MPPEIFTSLNSPPTTTSTYLKMIQWLNVRAVRAIKASMFEGRTPLPALSLLPPLSLLIPVALLSLSS